MYSKVKKLLIFILLLLFIIPNNAMAQTNYKPEIQYKTRAENFVKWVDILFKHIIDIQKNVITINKPGVYNYGDYNGTIIINVGNVTLKDTSLKGSLIITDKASNSDIILDNVQVKGKIDNFGKNVNLQTVENSVKNSSKKKSKTNNYDEIVSEIKKNLSLEVQGAVGRKASPRILLPVSDNKGYQSSITWISDNPDFIKIEGNEAIIFRRGVDKEHEHDCEGESITASSLLMFSQVMSLGCSDSSEPTECGGTGGDSNIVCLTATIKKGSTVDNKSFYVNIPWGWGRAITVGDNPDSGHDHDHEVFVPIDNNYPDKQLYMNQNSLYILPEDLAQYGETISNVECIDICPATTAGAITGSGIVAINIIDNTVLKIEPLAQGTLSINADVENSLGKIRVNFKLTISPPESVDDLTAVNKSYENSKLKLYSLGKDSKQINKLILPDTDCFGYGTSIIWESDKNDFINLDTEEGFGIINRRGASEGGCDDHLTEDALITIMHSDGEESCSGGCSDSGGCGDDSHDEGGCGCDDGSHDNSSKGKGTNVNLKATISKGDVTVIKTITIRIPWGWGRAISINY